MARRTYAATPQTCAQAFRAMLQQIILESEIKRIVGDLIDRVHAAERDKILRDLDLAFQEQRADK